MEQKWKKPRHVEWLSVASDSVGQGHYGVVYLGKIKFKGSRPFSVVVKRFKRPLGEDLNRYRAVVERLRRSGAPIPKTGFIQHLGQWVQVTHAFVGARQTKILEILPPAPRDKMHEEVASHLKRDKRTRIALIDAIARIVNAGYHPALDSIGAVQTKTGLRFVVHDLDQFVHFQRPKHHPTRFRHDWHSETHFDLRRWIREISSTGVSRKEVTRELRQRIKHRRALEILGKIE